MLRTAAVLPVALVLVVMMQHKLSDSGPRRATPSPPELWEPAAHADAHRTFSAPRGCVFLIPLERDVMPKLTSVEDGVAFDLDGNGDPEQLSWTEGGAQVAFLAIDHDGDGRIANGRELIGSRAVPGAGTAPDALIAWAKKGSAGHPGARLDSDNSRFLELLLWTDTNHNGVSEASELRSARHVLSDIGLGFERHHRQDRHGNESRYRGFVHVRTASGVNRVSTPADDVARMRLMFDACLRAR